MGIGVKIFTSSSANRFLVVCEQEKSTASDLILPDELLSSYESGAGEGCLPA